MYQTKTLLLLAALFICSCATAQTLHIIGFYDTNDPSIGKNKEAERQITLKEMDIISEVLEDYGYDSEYSEYTGTACNKENLIRAINGLDITPNKDIVFFYYGGHGTRAVGDSDPFPQMCLGEDYSDDFVPLTLVKNIIAKKNPRLALVISGCCNKEHRNVAIKSLFAESPYTSEANINKEAIKKLFVDSSGILEMTSSKAGEYSYSGEQGGVFCLYFWALMEELWEGNVDPDWNTFCSLVTKVVGQQQINTKEGIAYQHPYFEFSGQSTPQQTVPRQTTKTTTVNGQNSSLSQDLNKLADQTLTPDQRLSMVNSIKNKHFSSNAKVITIGSDMKTMVDYEDASDFLQRIALSPFIEKISVIEGEGAGMHSQIKIHEIRK